MIVDGWIAMAAFAMVVYVVLGGFDLGIGILTIGQRDPKRRQAWVALVSSSYAGNESWMVLVAALLLAGAPGVCAVFLPTVSVPVAVMVASLIVRGIAIVAMRSLPSSPNRWPLLIATGSVVAAFSQGVAATAIADTASRHPAVSSGSGASGFLSWHSLLGGFAATAVYAFAGAVWAARTGDVHVQRQATRVGSVLLPCAAALIALWAALLTMTPTVLPPHSDGQLLLVAGAVLIGVTVGVGLRSEIQGAWFIAIVIVTAEVLTVGVTVGLRLAETLSMPTNGQFAAPASWLYLVLIVVAPCMPIVLFLNGYSVWRFRGRLIAGQSRVASPARPGRPGRAMTNGRLVSGSVRLGGGIPTASG